MLLRHGTLIVFAWVFAVQLGVPIPTVPLLVTVGALGGLGKLNLGWALLAALGGSVLADLIWYGVGRRWGHRVLRLAAVDRARRLFLAHRLAALVIGKFFEVNAAVAALAGTSGIGVVEFLVYDIGSALVWAGTWGGLGWVLHDRMPDVTVSLAPLGMGMIIETAVALTAYGALKYGKRVSRRARDEHMSGSPRRHRRGPTVSWPGEARDRGARPCGRRRRRRPGR